MSYYSFNLKKGKFKLQIVSSDKKFVIKQFEKIYSETMEKKQTPKISKKTKPPAKPIKEKISDNVPEVLQKETKEELSDKAPEVLQKESKEDLSDKTPEVLQKESKEELSDKSPEILQEKPVKKEEQKNKKPENLNKNKSPEKEPDEIKEKITESLPKETQIPETENKKEENTSSVNNGAGKALDKFLYSGKAESKEPQTEESINETEQKKESTAKTESETSFQNIIEKKLNEELPEETEEKEEKLESPKETITFYETHENEEENEDIPPEAEEKELTELLKKNFEARDSEKEVKPKQESKKNVYDILHEKLASLPEDVKNRLNLHKEKAEQSDFHSLKFNSLEDLIYLKKPQTKLDCLLITSYYLKQHEAKEKYSLKQINARIVEHIKEPIDHSVIHEAVSHNYFEVAPDYTGTSDITEYRITEEGIDYILNEL